MTSCIQPRYEREMDWSLGWLCAGVRSAIHFWLRTRDGMSMRQAARWSGHMTSGGKMEWPYD